MPTAPDVTTCDWPGRPELTRRIIGYLAVNPEARRWAYYLGTNLCSEFGRKSHVMRKLTEHIFRNDIVHKEAYLKKPKVFEKRANSYLRQLKVRYEKARIMLRDVDNKPDSVKHARLEIVRAKFHWWDDVNKLWERYLAKTPESCENDGSSGSLDAGSDNGEPIPSEVDSEEIVCNSVTSRRRLRRRVLNTPSLGDAETDPASTPVAPASVFISESTTRLPSSIRVSDVGHTSVNILQDIKDIQRNHIKILKLQAQMQH